MRKLILLAFTFHFSPARLLLILVTAGGLLTSNFCFAQSKMNFAAALASKNAEQRETVISLLVRGNVAEIKNYVEAQGAEYRYAVGDIASINIKGKDIEALASKPFVKRIEAKNPHSKLQPMNDSMLINNRVIPIHMGMSPLLQAYKGKGVVIGIIDTGIDFRHGDFQDSLGKTRIKFLWDQVLSTSNPPAAPYNYGREYTANAIDNLFANAHLSTAALYGGHGTHVASHATGNGLAVGNYGGVAPEADIVFVALDFNNPNGIVDAAGYIYAKAAQLGKPCVINASLGDYYGSHDGLDLQAQAIKNLITAQNGRSFAAAAGNCGHCPFHLGYTVSATDTNFTWFNNSGGAYIAIYSDTNDFKNVQFTIGADKPGPAYGFRGNLPFTTIAPHVGVLMNDTIWNGSNRLCTIQSYGDLVGGVYSMEYNIFPDSANYNWRLMTTGTGKFDQWSFDVVMANLADTTTYPALKKYIQPDVNSTVVSSFQCLDEVITVGSYLNRNQYVDADTNLQLDTTVITGKLSYYSSRGPTRDNRIKPDITTPGEWILGCIVVSASFPNWALGVGGMHTNGGGTSFATPSAAGIAALYLEMDPGAGWQEIKDAITNCARTDSFTTTNVPNNVWGYGKADAFAALTGCATSVNGNSLNAFDDFIIYPNPASTFLTLIAGGQGKQSLHIYNTLGEKVGNWQLAGGANSINVSNLPAGIYFCTFHHAERIIATKKIVITD